MKNLITLSIVLLFVSACSKPYFLANDFEERTKNHVMIAVLPTEVITTGKMPKDLSDEDLQEIEESESEIFMSHIYNSVLNSGTKKKHLYIKVQSYTTTLSILEDNNISIRDSWKMKPHDLAALMGVDAVVQSSVSKKRYLSDFASYGISVGVQVAEQVAGGILGSFIPNNLSKTNDVRVSYALVNKEDASTLYSRTHFSTTDYRSKPEDVVRYGAVKYGRKFPYRRKD